MVKKLLLRGMELGLCGLILIGLILSAPKLHRTWLRNKVSQEVVKIVNEAGNSGGTGSYIKLPSGNVAILTNAHVCGVKNKDGLVWVQNDSERAIPRKVLEESKTSDLCLVEALPNHKGLSLGSQPLQGEIIHIVGHPRLYPTTMTSGEVFSKQYIDVLLAILNEEPNFKCDLPKNKIEHLEGFFGSFDLCLEHIESLLSTAPIMPGNSGSPVVDDYGRLIGVAFAGQDLGWSILIQLKDVKDFIKQY